MGNEESAFDPVEEGEVREEVSVEDVLGEGALDDSEYADADSEEGSGSDEQGAVESETPTAPEEHQPAEPEPTETPEPHPVTPEQSAEAQPQLVPVRIERQGQVVELHVSPEEAEVLNAMQTSAAQLPHVQKLLLEARQASGEPLPGQPQQQIPPQQEQAPPPFDQKAFVEGMKDRLDRAVESGSISDDFRTLYPDEAATAVYMFDEMRKMAEVINTAQQQAVQTEAQTERQQFKSRLFDDMKSLADGNPGMFGNLGEQETRDAFFQFLWDHDVSVQLLQPDHARSTLARYYAAFTAPVLEAGIRAAANQATATASAERVRATGSGAGGGGARARQRGPKFPDIAEVLGD